MIFCPLYSVLIPDFISINRAAAIRIEGSENPAQLELWVTQITHVDRLKKSLLIPDIILITSLA